jgi:RHS repeat-associated protein
VPQLANLHGDILATAALSETETKLLSSTDTTEYGVPTTSTPPSYSYMGAEDRRTEFPSGIIAMGARSYIPQLGRFLQTDPVPGGSGNPYGYTNGDPVNSSDPSGDEISGTGYGTLSDVSTGPGVPLPEGHDVVPGAILAPPVNKQIEEAFAANPPWAAASVFSTAPAEEEYAEENIELGVPGEEITPHFITYAGCYGPGNGCGKPGQKRTPYNNGEHGGTRAGHGGGGGGSTSACDFVAGGGGGTLGGAIGTALGGPGGGMLGGALGSWAASKVCG